jgi:hypothetical protein
MRAGKPPARCAFRAEPLIGVTGAVESECCQSLAAGLLSYAVGRTQRPGGSPGALHYGNTLAKVNRERLRGRKTPVEPKSLPRKVREDAARLEFA